MDDTTKAALATASGLGVIYLVKEVRAARKQAKKKKAQQQAFIDRWIADYKALDTARDMLLDQMNRGEIHINSYEEAMTALKFNHQLIRDGLV